MSTFQDVVTLLSPLSYLDSLPLSDLSPDPETIPPAPAPAAAGSITCPLARRSKYDSNISVSSISNLQFSVFVFICGIPRCRRKRTQKFLLLR